LLKDIGMARIRLKKDARLDRERLKDAINKRAASDATSTKKPDVKSIGKRQETVKSTKPFAPKDNRSIFNDRRRKESADNASNAIKKASAVLSYVPVVGPYAMGLNSAMGASDAYFNYKSGDMRNATIDAVGAIPIPSYKALKMLGSGFNKKIKAKATKAAMLSLGIDAFGTASDLTDNFTKQKK
jgi:hypothetical protein